MDKSGHLMVPCAEMPVYLAGLEPPFTVEDALAYAEEHGASVEVLEFIESLPGAVFSTRSGIRHAFCDLDEDDMELAGSGRVLVGADGMSS